MRIYIHSRNWNGDPILTRPLDAQQVASVLAALDGAGYVKEAADGRLEWQDKPCLDIRVLDSGSPLPPRQTLMDHVIYQTSASQAQEVHTP